MALSSRKHIQFAVITVIGATALALLILVGVELGFRLAFSNRTVERGGFQIDPKLGFPARELTHEIPVRLGAPAHPSRGRVSSLWDPQAKKYFSPGYFVDHPRIGMLPSPNRRVRSYYHRRSGELIYDVSYTIGPDHHRVTPQEGRERRRNILLVMGCSVVFGEGLEDDQTLPAAVARAAPTHEVFNYAFHGWGPGNLLRLVNEPEMMRDVRQTSDGQALYVFIDDHMRRVVGNMSLIQLEGSWTEVLPYYFLDHSGALRSNQMLEDGRGWVTPLHRLLYKSELLRSYSVDFPSRFTEQHFLLFAKVVAELKAALAKRKLASELTVVFYPGSKLARYLAKLLNDEGVRFIDYSSLDLTQYLDESPIILRDGHPSAAANRWIGQQIALDLGLGARGRDSATKNRETKGKP